VRPIIYALTILIVPGGFLFCAVNVWNRRQKRLRIEARLNSITRASLDDMRRTDSWEHAAPYGHGSASLYVPDWAVPEDKRKKK
jgi:hypothetical protein